MAAPAPSAQGPHPTLPAAKGGSPGTCTRQVSKQGVVRVIDVTQGPLRMQGRLSFNADGSSEVQRTVTRDGKLLYQMDASAKKGGGGAATITYGAGVAPVAKVTTTTSDDTTVQGEMDGRAFTAARKASTPRDFHFTDGQPVPSFQADPKLASQIAALRKSVTASLAQCATAGGPAAHKTKRVIHKKTASDNGVPRNVANQNGYTYEPGESQWAPACTQCENDCGTTAGDESWTEFFTLGASEAEIAVEYGICMAACQFPGGGCCPVKCGGEFVCCGGNDTCFEGGICCLQPSIVCNNVCCSPNVVTSCAPDGTCGCGSMQTCGDWCCYGGNTCCGGTTCCPSDTRCCGPTCCPKGQSCCDNKVCVPPGYECCDGDACVKGQCRQGKKGKVCCAGPLNDADQCCGLNAVCKDVCCPPGGVCIDGKCCPQGQACGKVCCAGNSSCKDYKKSTCGPGCKTSGTGSLSVVGPTGEISCAGVCCPAADKNGPLMCCGPYSMDLPPYNNMKYGCHHGAACLPILK